MKIKSSQIPVLFHVLNISKMCQAPTPYKGQMRLFGTRKRMLEKQVDWQKRWHLLTKILNIKPLEIQQK